jgi:hypothetical protein
MTQFGNEALATIAGATTLSVVFIAIVSYMVRKMDKIADEKISKEVFVQYCQRIDDHLKHGETQFLEIKSNLSALEEASNATARTLAEINTTVRLVAKNIGVVLKRETDN